MSNYIQHQMAAYTRPAHDCLGTLHSGGDGEQAHTACSECHAFQYDYVEGPFPTGTDEAANRAAWDAGDDRSPDAV